MTQRYSPSIVENPATCTIYAGMDPDPKGLFVRYEFEAAQARDIWYARAMALETENDRLSAKVSELIDANDEAELKLDRIREALREHDCVAFGEELMAAFDEAFGEKWSL